EDVEVVHAAMITAAGAPPPSGGRRADTEGPAILLDWPPAPPDFRPMNQASVLSPGARGGILALLAVVMLATRINHFGALPDASWAVFFIAGFYLRGWGRWAFPLLMALAVAIDYVVISG